LEGIVAKRKMGIYKMTGTVLKIKKGRHELLTKRRKPG